jgi:hypothetical protein
LFQSVNIAQAGAPYQIVFSGTRHVYAGYDAYIRFSTQTTAPKNLIFNSITAPTGITAEVLCPPGPPFDCPTTTDGRKFMAQAGVAYSIVLRFSATQYVTPGQYSVVLNTEMDGVKNSTTLSVVVSQPTPVLPAPTLLGPDIPTKSKWESAMISLGNKWCNTSQVFNVGDESQVWFYDGARVYFQIADYTRDKKWEACALNIARQYRDYVLAWNGRLSAWRVHSRGLLMAWQRTGDASYKTALDLLSRNSPYAGTGGTLDYSGMRESAFVLEGYIAAEKAGLPRNPLLGTAATALIGQFAQLFLPYTVNKPVGAHQTFMDGLGAEALIEYYELTGDPRVPPTIKTMLDWMWTNAWSPTKMNLMVNPEPYGPQCSWGCREYNSVLINLSVPTFAWYWQLTGDSEYQRRGDEIFSHALDTDPNWDGKVFSQNYRWSFDYIKWRSMRRGGQPQAHVTGVYLYPPRMRSSYTLKTNLVIIDVPAPAGGVVVTLASSVPAAAQPQATVVIPAGYTSAPFSITSYRVSADTPITISASAGGVTKTSSSMTIVP